MGAWSVQVDLQAQPVHIRAHPDGPHRGGTAGNPDPLASS